MINQIITIIKLIKNVYIAYKINMNKKIVNKIFALNVFNQDILKKIVMN